jgi:hypothetical protein
VTVQGNAVSPSTDQPDLYVPGAPSLITNSGAWSEPSAPLEGLLDRYIDLGRQGVLPERPTFAESLTASREMLTTRVVVGQQELQGAEADQLRRPG